MGEKKNAYTAEQKKAFAEEKNAIYRGYLQTMTPADLDEDVRSTLLKLRADGHKLAVGSSSKNAPLILERIGLGSFFDAVADGTQITHSKPDPEDTLLAAMENASKEDMPDDAERKGIGTPATRSGIIEKLVSSGFVERRKSKKITNLLPTSTGTALITVLPEQLQSPQLTAEWEHRLKEIERGEIAPDSFMDGIAAMLHELVQTYKPIPGTEVLFPSGREVVGKCPRCGAEVTESPKGFFCENRACSFVLWKNSRFFTAKKKVLTKSLAAALLKNGRAPLKGCYSEKTGKTYDASVLLEDDGQRTGYKMVFDNG